MGLEPTTLYTLDRVLPTELPRQLSWLGPNLTSHSTPDEQANHQLSMKEKAGVMKPPMTPNTKHVQYASKKTSHKRTVQRGARSHSRPVQAPFDIIGSPVRVYVRFARFLHYRIFSSREAQVQSQEDYREARKYAKKYLEVSDARARFEPLTVSCDRKGGGAARVR